MENQLEQSDFVNLQEVERINALNINAEKTIEKFNYSKPLTESDIAKKNSEINQALQRINELSEDKKDLSAMIKEQTKIISENNQEVISKFVQVSEKVWEIINPDSGYIETINKDGFIVEKTRIKSGTQMNLFGKKKEAI